MVTVLILGMSVSEEHAADRRRPSREPCMAHVLACRTPTPPTGTSVLRAMSR